MIPWKDSKFINPRKKVFKNLDTNEILNLELQDDPDNVIEQSHTPINAHNLNKMQTDIINDMSKKYTGTTITAPTVEGFGRVDKIYGDTVEVGTGEKSPDNPYELKCVGNDVNLFDINKYPLKNGLWIGGNNNIVNSTIGYYIAFPIKGGETYTISKKYNSTTGGEGLYFHYTTSKEYPANGVQGIDQWAGNKNYTKLTITPNEEAKYLFLCLIASDNVTSDLLRKATEELKIQKGSITTPYSNYGEGTVEIISENGSNRSSNIIYKVSPLCAIKDIEDNIIAQDYIEGTKVYRECELKILDGTEKWIKSVGTSTDDITACWITLNNAGIYNCDKFEIIQSGDTSTKQEVMVVSNTAISIKVLNSRLSSADAVGFKEWLAKNPVTIVYRLETPIVEDINGSNKIFQYAESTTIYNRDNAELEVSLTNNNTISNINENFKHIEKNVSSLQMIENWKTLINGIMYRKKGNDVQVNISYVAATTISATSSKTIAQLPEKYRPEIQLNVPLFARNLAGTIFTALYLTIETNGSIAVNNGSASSITAEVFKAYVKY